MGHENLYSRGFADDDDTKRSLDDAKQACLASAECKAVTCKEKDEPPCTIRKSGAESLEQPPIWDERERWATTTHVCRQPYIGLDRNCPENHIGDWHDLNLEECELKCDRDPACVGVSWMGEPTEEHPEMKQPCILKSESCDAAPGDCKPARWCFYKK